MFSMSQKENEVQKLIKTDGLEHAAKRFSEILLGKCGRKEIALQFILEEIEAASKGNDVAMLFAKSSGFEPSEYSGAMDNSRPEVDGPDGPQQFLLYLTSSLKSDIDLMVNFRTTVVDNMMKKGCFGRYSRDGDVNEIMQKLREIYKKDGVEEALIISQASGQVGLNHAADLREMNNLIQQLCELKGTTIDNILSELN